MLYGMKMIELITSTRYILWKRNTLKKIAMKGDNWRKIEIFSLALFGISVGNDIICNTDLVWIEGKFFHRNYKSTSWCVDKTFPLELKFAMRYWQYIYDLEV